MLRSSPPATTRRAIALAIATLLVTGCGTAPDAGDATTAPPDSTSVPASRDLPTVSIEGRDLVLVTGQDRQALGSIEDGELVHAELRPAVSPDGATTVLALARVDGRYELRYLNVDADGVASDLYWFPFRMQVDPESAGTADVPTLPVWAPDGSAVAWLEWGADGTRLRTVGWLDHDEGTNPSDDQATYGLDEVPVGAQLVVWEVGDDGVPELVSRGADEQRWRIRIEGDAAIVALDALP